MERFRQFLSLFAAGMIDGFVQQFSVDGFTYRLL